MNLIDYEQLTPGATFTRKSGAQSRVLFLTNTTLPAKAKAKHPENVVYVNEEGAIFNKTVEDFLADNTFYNVDPDLEDALTKLPLIPGLTAGDGELDIIPSNTQVVLASEFTSDDQADTEDFSVMDPELGNALSNDDGPRVTFTQANPHVTDALVTAEALSQRLVRYSETPSPVTQRVIHELVFEVNNAAEVQALQASFNPENGSTNAIYNFELSGPFFSQGHVSLINWDTSLGAWPYFENGQTFVRIMLATEQVEFLEDGEDDSSMSMTEVSKATDPATPMDDASDEPELAVTPPAQQVHAQAAAQAPQIAIVAAKPAPTVQAAVANTQGTHVFPVGTQAPKA